MFSLSTPFWLLGLLALPVIWWLHRHSQRPRNHKVSAVWLWPKTDELASEVKAQPLSDFRWWLHAAILVLFLLALAGLGTGLFAKPPITLWLDDSLSMQTQEQGLTRQQLALRQLQPQLESAGVNEITIHPLSDHANPITIESVDTAQWQASVAGLNIGRNPVLPEHLDANSQHWLVTDGADPALLKSQRFHKLLLVGQQHTNAALSHVSVRPSLLQAQGPMIAAFNVVAFTTEPMSRTLSITADGQTIKSLPLNLTDGEYQGQFDVPRGTQHLSLVLDPADSLSLDDRFELSLANLHPLPVTVSNSCGARFQSALDANPMLQRLAATANPTQAKLIIRCGDTDTFSESAPSPIAIGVDRILVHRNASMQTVENPLRWHAEAAKFNQLHLDARLFSRATYTGNGTTLLSAGPTQQPLIVREGPETHVLMDLDLPPITGDTAYPYLVNTITQLATTRNIINPTVSRSRDVRQSRIAPLPRPSNLTAPSSSGITNIDLTNVILSILLALLLLDITRQLPLRAWFAERTPQQHPQAIR